MQSKILKLLELINEHHHNHFWHSEKAIWIKSGVLALTGSAIWELAAPDLIHTGIKLASLPLGVIVVRVTFLIIDKFMPLKSKSNDSSTEKNQHKD